MFKMKSVRTASFLLILSSIISLPSYASIPTTGKGMWIWEIWNAENGSLTSVISRLKATGVSWVAVKLGDSNSPWDRPTENLYTWASQYGGFDSVIAKFHENGIKVFGWQYVYGKSMWSGTGTLQTEADVTNEVLDIPGIDGFIIDAEAEFEGSGMTTVAAQYMDSIRTVHPNSFVALTSFARVTGHPIPWTTFLRSCDANMPQAYWALRPTTVSSEFNSMRSDFETSEQIWINQGYISSIKPIVPIGCENSEGETNYQMRYGDIQQLCSLVQGVGYVGVSLWEYAGMDTMNWRDYAASWVNKPPTVPQVTSALPPSTGSVPAYDSIKVNFNTPMDAASVYAAFSISPPVNGTLRMNPDFTQWTFIPSTVLAWSTQYSVTIDSSAASLLGVHLNAPLSFKFTTVQIDTTGPYPIAESPMNHGFSNSHAYVEFIMNEPVQYSSFPGRISLKDSTGKPVAFSKDLFQVTPDNRTLVSIRAAFPLQPGMIYTAALAPGLTDYYGNPSKVGYSTTFGVDTLISSGNILENFEDQGTDWISPLKNPKTVGVDSLLTSFATTTARSYVGYGSGMLTYRFDSTSGFCELDNTSGFSLDSGVTSVGMWVFADNSGNVLRYCFGSSGNSTVTADTLNWYGWRFVQIPVSEIPGGSKLLKGVAVVQSDSAILRGGTIYIDAIQTYPLVTLVTEQSSSVPSTYVLQNYPNPFNPSTKIDYALRETGKVSIKVYDVLGREVATLVDRVQSAGQHSVTFNAGNLPSGVYIYSLTTPNGTHFMKKMILVK